MTFHVEPAGSDDNVIPGGWTPFETPTSEDKTMFKTAMKGMYDVNYSPVSVSKQVVAGMNYHFFCYGKLVTPGTEQFPAIVKVYVAPSIQAHYPEINNFFDRRSTNAASESFNAKIKEFRAQFRGVKDKAFFLFRLAKIYA